MLGFCKNWQFLVWSCRSCTALVDERYIYKKSTASASTRRLLHLFFVSRRTSHVRWFTVNQGKDEKTFPLRQQNLFWLLSWVLCHCKLKKKKKRTEMEKKQELSIHWRLNEIIASYRMNKWWFLKVSHLVNLPKIFSVCRGWTQQH